MNLWMRISLSLVLILPKLALACSFKNEAKKIFSLSGPVTVALKETGLLSSSRISGISVFHPISKDEFKGNFLPGGIFLSRQMMEGMRGSIVFFDESRELAKMFKSIEGVHAYEIKTRGQLPHETTDLVLIKLKEVTTGCENKFKELKNKSDQLSSQLLEKIPGKIHAVFFLGEIKNDRTPEMAIVKDGVVKWLLEKKKLQTYPSSLAYVNWSAKMMNELPRDTLLVGIKDPGSEMTKEVKKLGNKKFNLIYPGALVPGITQLEAWLYFLNSI